MNSKILKIASYYKVSNKCMGLFCVLLFSIGLAKPVGGSKDSLANKSVYIVNDAYISGEFSNSSIITTDSDKEENPVRDLTNPKTESKKNIEKGLIYVSENTYIYGFSHLNNYKLNVNKVIKNSSNFAFNKQKLKQSKYKANTKVTPTVFIKIHGYKHFFGLYTNSTENAVLNNTNKLHFLHHNNFYIHLCSEDDVRIPFSIYNFSLIKRKIKFYYTRPPPFFILFS